MLASGYRYKGPIVPVNFLTGNTIAWAERGDCPTAIIIKSLPKDSVMQHFFSEYKSGGYPVNGDYQAKAKGISSSSSTRPLENNPTLYESSQLNNLLLRKDICKTWSSMLIIDAGSTSSSNELLKVVRYVVNEDGKFVFGNEGYPANDTPAHSQMAERCFASGNLFFDDDNTLIAINNKSGDFRQQPETLQVALWKLFQDKIPMKNQFLIIINNRKGSVDNVYLTDAKKLEHELSQCTKFIEHFNGQIHSQQPIKK